MNFNNIAGSRLTTLALVTLVTVFGIHAVGRGTENLRLDLTQDNLYSLSEGTIEILDKMQQEGVKPVDIKLYFSLTSGKSLPSFIKDFITYENYLKALLKEYELASKGKIRISFIDPVTDSDDAQDAQDDGLDGKPINQHGDLFFFGLVFQTQTGSKDVIEFLWPNRQETIEYEISKTLHSLLWPIKKRIGVMSSLEVVAEASNPYMAQILAAQGKNPGSTWIAMELLQETYEVSKIDADTDEISPDEVDLLVVIHPKDFSERALFAIDQWIARGGNTLLFIDPYTLEDRPPQNPQQPWAAYQYEPTSDLARLLEKWGLKREENAVAADFDLAIKRQVGRLGGAQRLLVDLLIDESVKDQTLATDHPIFQGLSDLRFFLAGSLVRLDLDDGEGDDGTDSTGSGESSGLQYTPLITTTAKGNTLTVKAGFPGDDDLVFLDLNDPGKIQDKFEPGSKPVVMAWQVHGKLPLLYPDGGSIPGPTPAPPPGLPPGMNLPPQVSSERIRKDPVPEEERGEATVLVFADVDFISDQVAFQNTPFGAIAANDNHKVLLNAVDYLFGSEELMKVRSKKKIERPFSLFDEIERQADEQTLVREKELRQEIASFEEQLRDKQSTVGGNQALLKKQLQDEIDELSERISQANRELREIRKEKRAALQSEESRVRWMTLGFTPSLVLALGLALFVRRRNRDQQARRSTR
jgi:ABC-type uncharacterized transport system involved in gliding motility auxiliary subunit